MPIEIERKFLVKGPVILPTQRQKILQGYLPDDTLLEVVEGFLHIRPVEQGPTVKLPLSAQLAVDTQNYAVNPIGARALRIRLVEGEPAIFCMKVNLRSSLSRIEIEVEVPELDALYLLQTCKSKTLRKTRYQVEYDGHAWDVDLFGDPFNGLITAEIELLSEYEPFTAPPWIGAEVTDNPKFSNRALAESQKVPTI